MEKRTEHRGSEEKEIEEKADVEMRAGGTKKLETQK